jgi:hypothetical protein
VKYTEFDLQKLLEAPADFRCDIEHGEQTYSWKRLKVGGWACWPTTFPAYRQTGYRFASDADLLSCARTATDIWINVATNQEQRL